MAKENFTIANPRLLERFTQRYPEKKQDLLDALDDICVNPIGEPPLKKHLKGQLFCNWRRRIGHDFRIRYTFNTATRQIRILELGPRGTMY
jgi:mRNA-degrading endonuclease RelE of RelBE toxin-antitoxin system